MPLEDTTEDHPDTEPPPSYHLHAINSIILVRQIPSQGISFQLWPPATTLITLLDRHRTSHPSPLFSLFDSCAATHRRLRLLELGSGTGAVGIAAAALLGASVTITDLPHVLPNLQFNIAANAKILELHGGAVDAAALQWGQTTDMEAIGREYDAILGSDLVYHENLYEPLLETLRFLLLGSEQKVVFLMSHLKRWKK
ncbi:UNVERIFIED_CONTAM: protein N-lysine methyltransferase METTL21A [Sesamum angustifolium]|uniref:Protein N-lysine methyltransferase METTL21A n=1 Tax=Sesamum angustifolium TaxID=2727405 RepID=A0AAW2NGZ1_9LAMI